MKLRSLKSSAGFVTFVLDQLGGLGDVTSKAMFGGVGLYCDGLFFGIIARDELYLKADDETRGIFEATGSRPFRPYPNRSGTMQYYSVPLDVLESAPELLPWARKALAVARSPDGGAKRPRYPKISRRVVPLTQVRGRRARFTK
jgi:DNA transformation protein